MKNFEKFFNRLRSTSFENRLLLLEGFITATPIEELEKMKDHFKEFNAEIKAMKKLGL